MTRETWLAALFRRICGVRRPSQEASEKLGIRQGSLIRLANVQKAAICLPPEIGLARPREGLMLQRKTRSHDRVFRVSDDGGRYPAAGLKVRSLKRVQDPLFSARRNSFVPTVSKRHRIGN